MVKRPEKQLEFDFMKEEHKAERKEKIGYYLKSAGIISFVLGSLYIANYFGTHPQLRESFEQGLKYIGENLKHFPNLTI